MKRVDAHRLRPALLSALLVLALAALAIGIWWPLRPCDCAPLVVEYAGCATVHDGPVCELRAHRELVLFYDGAAGERAELRVDGVALQAKREAVSHGWRYRVTVPASGGRLTLRLTRNGSCAAWELALSEPAPPGVIAAAEALRAQGRGQEAEALLAREAPSLTPADQARALSLRGRLARVRGDTEQASRLLRDGIRAHRALGQSSEALRDSVALMHTLIYRSRRFAEAREVLDAAGSLALGASEGLFHLEYNRGLFAGNTGDYRTAVRCLANAMRLAESAGLTTERRLAGQVLAMRLQHLGRGEEARALLDELWRTLDDGAGACERAQLLHAAAWARMEAWEDGDDRTESALPPLSEARQLFDGPCKDSAEQLNVRMNQALASLLEGRLAEAAAFLAEAESLSDQHALYYALWDLDIRGRLALAQGKAGQARPLFERLDLLARSVVDAEAEWRAAVGLGRSLLALGDAEGGLAALARAERLVDQAALQLALGDGRMLLGGGRQAALELYVDMLLRADRPADALAVVRRAAQRAQLTGARARALSLLGGPERTRWESLLASYRSERELLSALVEREWQLPREELAAARAQRQVDRARLQRTLEDAFALLGGVASPESSSPPLAASGDDTVALVYFPLGDRWIAFAAEARGLTVARLGAVDSTAPPAQLAAQLLSPFNGPISRAATVKVLAHGALSAVDFHALPWQDATLVDAKDVVYALDLAVPATPATPATPLAPDASAAPPRALIVSDARGDLPAVRADAALAREHLEKAGWQVTTLAGEQADATAVDAAMAGVTLFHYSGHGAFRGADGWDSALLLASGTESWVTDILAVGAAPKWVVLLGCDTGRASERLAPSLGLAQAFLSAGSVGVIASARPLDGRVAALLTRFLYAADDALVPREARITSRWSRALRQLKRAAPSLDWASARIYVP